MKTRGIAYVNHGRWLVDCPECGSPILLKPENETAICPVCNPGVMATTFQRRQLRSGAEVFDLIPDHERRQDETAKARPFKVVIPKDWKKIFEMLRKRHVSFMNWLPGETLDDLKAENILHGLKEK